METSLHFTETHFGLADFNLEDWKNVESFDSLVGDVEYWLERDLSKREKADLYSLYLQNVENY